jgi:hypothetical protein
MLRTIIGNVGALAGCLLATRIAHGHVSQDVWITGITLALANIYWSGYACREHSFRD